MWEWNDFPFKRFATPDDIELMVSMHRAIEYRLADVDEVDLHIDSQIGEEAAEETRVGARRV